MEVGLAVAGGNGVLVGAGSETVGVKVRALTGVRASAGGVGVEDAEIGSVVQAEIKDTIDKRVVRAIANRFIRLQFFCIRQRSPGAKRRIHNRNGSSSVTVNIDLHFMAALTVRTYGFIVNKRSNTAINLM